MMKWLDKIEMRSFGVAAAIAVLLATLIAAGTFPTRHAFAQQVGPGGVPGANSGGPNPGGTTGAMQYNNNATFGGLNGSGIPNLNGSSAPTIATSAQIGAQLSADPADIDVDSINNAYLATDNATPDPNFYFQQTIPTSITSGYGNLMIATDGNGGLENVTSGSSNIALGGSDVLESDTTGSSNLALGTAALERNVSGSNNVAIGSSADDLRTAGNTNVTIGDSANSGETNTSSVSIGYQAGAVGSGAGANGNNDVAIGTLTGYSATGIANSTAIGEGATNTASDQVVIGSSGVNGTATTQSVIYGAPQFPSITTAGCGQLDSSGHLTSSGATCTGIVASGSASASANLSTLTVYTPAAKGVYRLCEGAVVTTVGSTGATLAMLFTYNNGTATQSNNALGATATATTLGADTSTQRGETSCQTFTAGAGTNIQIGSAIGGSPATNPTYSYWYTVEAL
jgi:hypothetical protein